MTKLFIALNSIAWTLLVVSLIFNYMVCTGKMYIEKPDYLTEITRGAKK